MIRTDTAIIAALLSVATGTGPLAAVALYLILRLGLRVRTCWMAVQARMRADGAYRLANEMIEASSDLRA